MQKGNLEKWTNISACTNLLFFVQLVNELLFDYSIPSNRISTLNSHFLCLDALSAIDGIDNYGVPEGTLKPIMEELFLELKKDPLFEDNNPLDYFLKYHSDRYVICSNPADMNYRDLRNTAKALSKVFFEHNNYYLQLRKRIIQIVEENDVEKQSDLFRMTKSVLTELKNKGYSLRYIYLVMNRVFLKSREPIDSPSVINDFFNYFDFQTNDYTIVFKVKENRINKLFNYLDELKCIDNLPEELIRKANSQFLEKNDGEAFFQIERKALDPFSAAEKAISTIEINSAVYRLFDHQYKYYIGSTEYLIFDSKRAYKSKKSLKAVEHTKKPSMTEIAESMEIASKAIHSVANTKNIDDFFSILSAIEYHSHSLDSHSEENQLLDLWAIFESVLNINNKHTSDRIQQVCLHLVPVLKYKYIYSLLKQLANDIRNYDEDSYVEIIQNATTEAEIVKNTCLFCLLEENREKREILIEKSKDFPLLTERIKYYSEVLNTPDKVYKFVEKHAERVKWQIMRIYRNRNLIIHNGSKMPYLSLLIENLHFYVDDFLTYTIHCLSNGKNIESMCQELFVKECRWNAMFLRSKDPITIDQIDYLLSL